MTMTKTLFDSAWASLPAARAQVRVDIVVIEKALCTGIARQRENSDEGQVVGAESLVRYLKTPTFDPAVKPGQIIEVDTTGNPQWSRVRVISRKDVEDVVHLETEAINA